MAVLGVLADDFTGACDTGVQFARAGMRTRMVMSSAVVLKRFGIDVVAYSTETRNLESNAAYRRVRDAVAFLSRNQIDIVFKKIDSTLRGPVAAELDGALDESGFHLAVVCPAFPANRRTLQDGILFVDGKPLESVTHANHGPLHLPSLLAAGSTHQIHDLKLDRVRAGAPQLAALFKNLAGPQGTIVVCDAETEADLAAIVDAAASVEEKVLLVGSAGLAMPYAMRAGVRRRRAVIVVAGTKSAVTQAQLARLPADCNRIIVDPQMAVERGQRWRRWLGVVANAPLAEAASPLYLVTVGPRVIEGTQDMSLRIASALGEVTEVLLRTISCDGMIVSGGETANAVMAQLRAEGIDLTEELLPGIPTGLVVAGPYAGMRIVTKAGGFGEIDALVKAIAYLRGEREAS